MKVVALHRPAPVSGVSAAGAVMARLPAPHRPWRPLMIGAEITPDVIAKSPLADAPGLEVCTWPEGTRAVDQVHRVRAKLDAMGADIVVPNDLPHGFLAGAYGRRVAGWYHSDSHEGEELFTRCGPLAYAWRCVSESALARLVGVAQELGLRVPAPGPVMPVCIDVPARVTPLPPATPLRLVSLGRLENYHKRSLDLAVLADELAALGTPFELVIAGDGPAAGALAARVEPHVRAARVRLLGTRTHAESMALLEAAHLLVLVSESEGDPTVVMEALARGRGVALTTGCGAAAARLAACSRTGQPHGVLVNTGAMRELAQALAGALARAESPSQLAAWGAAGRELAARTFGPDSRGALYDAFIADAANAPDTDDVEARWVATVAALQAIGPVSFDELRGAAERWTAERARHGRSTPTLRPDASLPPMPAERRVRAALERLTRAGATRVGLYGAGRHTRGLARLLEHETLVGAILDDAAAPGQTLFGRPVVPLAEFARCGCEAIILSSDEHERSMLARVQEQLPGVPVAPLYMKVERDGDPSAQARAALAVPGHVLA